MIKVASILELGHFGLFSIVYPNVCITIVCYQVNVLLLLVVTIYQNKQLQNVYFLI